MKRYLPFFFGAGAVLSLDQATKVWAMASFTPFRPVPVLGGVLRFTLVFNPGGVFGLGRAAGWFFIVVSVVVLLLILLHLPRVRGRVEQAAYGFLAGGALGNFLDRLRLGVVVDFLDLGFGRWRWPAFNLADAAITVGVGLLLWRGLRRD